MKSNDYNTLNVYPTSQSQDQMSQQEQMKYYKEDTAFRKEPLTLRKTFRLP
jgi:hypothetical protein